MLEVWELLNHYVLQRLNATKESRSLDDSQTWGDHFRPQSFWVRGGIRQKIVLVRSSSSLQESLAQALHFLSLPAAVNATLAPINTSRKKSSETSNGTLPFNGTRLGNLTLPHDDSALQGAAEVSAPLSLDPEVLPERHSALVSDHFGPPVRWGAILEPLPSSRPPQPFPGTENLRLRGPALGRKRGRVRLA